MKGSNVKKGDTRGDMETRGSREEGGRMALPRTCFAYVCLRFYVRYLFLIFNYREFKLLIIFLLVDELLSLYNITDLWWMYLWLFYLFLIFNYYEFKLPIIFLLVDELLSLYNIADLI